MSKKQTGRRKKRFIEYRDLQPHNSLLVLSPEKLSPIYLPFSPHRHCQPSYSRPPRLPPPCPLTVQCPRLTLRCACPNSGLGYLQRRDLNPGCKCAPRPAAHPCHTRGRPTECDTGVPWRGGGIISALYENIHPHTSKPVSHPTVRTRDATRMFFKGCL